MCKQEIDWLIKLIIIKIQFSLPIQISPVTIQLGNVNKPNNTAVFEWEMYS